jgi:hypothetical protein
MSKPNSISSLRQALLARGSELKAIVCADGELGACEHPQYSDYRRVCSILGDMSIFHLRSFASVLAHYTRCARECALVGDVQLYREQDSRASLVAEIARGLEPKAVDPTISLPYPLLG